MSFDALLHGELEGLFNPADTRRSAARRVFQLVADRLARPVEPALQAGWAAHFVEVLWPALHAERGGRWDLGWAELVAGFAVSIELLAGALPASIRSSLEGTAAHELWAQWRRPYSRYALLLDAGVRICRVLVGAGGRAPGEPVESTLSWRHEGPPLQGRSHTLLLALMADGLLPGTLGPVAATGELDVDGRTVRPVLGLVDKVKAWRAAVPEGTLITGPMGSLDEEGWRALAERKPYGAVDAEVTARWLTGGSMAELAAKLNGPAPLIRRWDGAVLDERGLAETPLDWSPMERPRTPFSGEPLLDAAWAASQQGEGQDERRGVLIEGPPGAGKSILSRVLEQRFRAGVLGALGFGVRRSARELAEDLRHATTRTWSALLAVREPERYALFEELERTRRLVPIVDGLDELGAVQLREVAMLLQTSPAWWMATSRPVANITAALPPAWTLEVRVPSQEEARKLLTGMGRADLVKSLYGDPLQFRQLPNSLAALTRTPLHLALLAKVTREDEHPEQLAPHELYRRVFQGLLDQACHDQRLTEREAHQLRVLRVNAIGELALAWLRAPAGYLDRATVDLILEEAGFKASERPDIVHAMEFGHLLAPAGDAWDFAHRTLAEWAASEALHRQVARQHRAHARASGKPEDREQRALIELAVLAPILEPRLLVDSSPWAQLLRFYAPHISEPLALLERFVGPGARSDWLRPDELPRLERPAQAPPLSRPASADEVLKAWDFVFELLSQAAWTRPEDARLGWGIAVRRWLLFEHSDERFTRQEEGLSWLKALAGAVASHLPMSLLELCAIAARTAPQHERLRTEPLLLLPAIPATHAPALEHLLAGDSREAQLKVLTWYAEHGLDVDAGVIHTLIQVLPAELAEAESRAEPDPPHDESPEVYLPRIAHSRVRYELEALVWETSLRTRQRLPWQLVRARLLLWPPHLEKAIYRWFGMRPEAQEASALELENQRRREVMAASLHAASTAARQLVNELLRLKAEPGGSEIAGYVWRRFDDSEDGNLQRLLVALAAKVDWKLPRYGSLLSTGEPGREQVLESGVRQLRGLQARLEQLLRALDDMGLEQVAGELWELLLPDQPEREVLLETIEAVGRPPPQVPVEFLLARQGNSAWRLEQTAWAWTHLQALRELAATGEGEIRFVAIRLLAKREARDEPLALLEALPSADETLSGLIRDELERQSVWAESVPTGLLPPEVLAGLPLVHRAERDVPGWRAELLARLSEPSDDVGPLVRLAERKGVREALPLLVRRLEAGQRADSQLVAAIAGLCTEADARWARPALRHALLHGWPDGRLNHGKPFPGEADRSPAGRILAGFLTLDDLDILARSTVSALHHPSLAEAIRRLGPEARERLQAWHREASEQVAGLEHRARDAEEPPSLFARQEDPTLEAARKRRDALAETLVASFDPARGGLACAVDLALQVSGGDVHLVYGLPGLLGSDFDEPGDLDWYSDQENAALVEALGRHMEAGLSHEPESWQELRRLFRHPSETLRQKAFELCADHAPPHQVAALALEALEGHARANQTRWTGNTAGLVLSGMMRGAGTSYVGAPDTLGRLVTAVRKRLTAAHRSVIEALVRHELPLFRALAARWAGGLGSESWNELLRPLLGDAEAEVVRSALDAMLLLAPERLDEALRQVDRSDWTSRHDTLVFQRLRAPRRKGLLAMFDEHPPVDALEHVPAETVELLLAQAAERVVPVQGDARRATTPFDGFPNPAEQLCNALWKRKELGPGSRELLRRWSPHGSLQVRAVARRLRAARGLLSREEVLPLLSGEPLEQLSAAECLVRMADESHREEASAVWRAALGSWEHRGRLGTQPLDPTELSDRLMWALRGASPAFAPLLGLMVRSVPYDSEDQSDTPEGERLVSQTLKVIRGWGEHGMAVLLELMETGEVEAHYHFTKAVKDTARMSETFRALLERMAAEGQGVAQQAFEELSLEHERQDLDGLAARLTAEVFPEGWPMMASNLQGE